MYSNAEESLLKALRDKGFTETDIFHLCTIVSKSVNPGTFIQKVAKVKFNKDVPKPKPGKTLAERETEFYNTLVPFLEKYGGPMLRKFFNHWKEPNPNKTLMKWEMQKTWDVAGRLVTWNENNFGDKQAPVINMPINDDKADKIIKETNGFK